ncbi:LuxR family transcriptional regulator [Micromonospora sp. WMMD812]|uniref:LuxR family transcriptional regulator n=1 Tax=Micromonospora sp. WMMD812 TaxID=3015152 RepID=UPI00248B1584|nr:LuxR family transcriptional regulator [Micromonospora sp. WMMD812]WBB67613.1 LuxR C-terminal-related transcriptional regulator [Micromonospora sp. WMMD812]
MHLLAGRALEDIHPPPVARLARHFREAGETQSWARYAEQGAELAMASGDHTKAVDLLVDLLSWAVLPPADRARVARIAGVAALGRREPVDEVYHRVIRTLRSVLETPGLSARQQAEIRNPLGRLLITGGEAQAALSELEQAVANLDHDPVEAARAMTYLGWAYAGPWPASTHRRWLDRAGELTAEFDSPAERLNLAGNRAAALLMLGEEEAWDVVAGLPIDGATSAERLDVARIHANVGTGALIWGRYADAEEHLAVAMRRGDTPGRPVRQRTAWPHGACASRRPHRMPRPAARQSRRPRARGDGIRAGGARLERAAAPLRRHARPRASSRGAHQGQIEQGRELLAAQYEHLFRLGARGDADRVAQRLREHGAEVPRLWRGGRRGYGDQLSPRELDVVQLVVAGKTNREISRILAKSPTTVDQQLRAAMRKLKVSSRTALAARQWRPECSQKRTPSMSRHENDVSAGQLRSLVAQSMTP